MGYCPFACIESQYNRVYHDVGPGGGSRCVGSSATIRPRQATTRLDEATI